MLQLENRFEPLINVIETEVEMTADKFRHGSIMRTASQQNGKKSHVAKNGKNTSEEIIQL